MNQPMIAIFQTFLFILYCFSIFGFGLWVVLKIMRSEENKIAILTISFFVGLFSHLSLLAIFIPFVSFPIINKVLLAVFGCVSLSVWSKLRELFKTLLKDYPDQNKRTLKYAILFVTVVNVFVNFGTTTYDAFFHEAVSASLTNGNIPLRWPWYPDYYAAYHFGYDLLLAATQDFTLIDMVNAHRPWYFVMPTLLGFYIFSLVYTYFESNFKLALFAGFTFLFFSATALYDLSQIVMGFFSKSDPLLVQIIGIQKNFGHSLTNYTGSSRHVIVFLKYPILFAILHILLFQRKESSRTLIIVMAALLLSFLCLCDEPLFFLCLGAMGLYIIAQRLWFSSQHMPLGLNSFLWILAATVVIIFVQGGLIPTKIFHSEEILPVHSDMYKLGGYSKLILKNTKEFFHFFSTKKFILYQLPILLVVLIYAVSYIKRLKDRNDFFNWSFIIATIFFGGFVFISVFTLSVFPKNIIRTFNIELGTIFLAILLCKATAYLSDRTAFLMRSHTITFLLILLYLPTFVWAGSASLLSVRYYVSNERTYKNKSMAFGRWLRDNLPSYEKVMGVSANYDPSNYQTNPADPRFTGVLSFGGNQYRDPEMIVDFPEYSEARQTVDHEFYTSHSIGYIILPNPIDSTNALRLLDTSKFQEIKSPFTDFRRVFRVLH